MEYTSILPLQVCSQNGVRCVPQRSGDRLGQTTQSLISPDRFCTKMPGQSELPSLVKEGCREAAGGSFNKINFLLSTTPALRATLLIEEGWTRNEENIAKLPYESAAGVVRNK